MTKLSQMKELRSYLNTLSKSLSPDYLCCVEVRPPKTLLTCLLGEKQDVEEKVAPYAMP